MLSIVEIVTVPKAAVTRTKSPRLPWAAGYMSRGMRGSHGPKKKIIKSTHGVIFLFPPV